MKNDNDKSKQNKQNENDEKPEVKQTGPDVEKLKKQNEELENKYKRALADYQNLQKRVNEDRHSWIKVANKELLLRIIPVLDTLLLAYQHSKSDELKVSINHFLDCLKSEGVVRIVTVGEKFNPEFMEAVEVVEGDDGVVVEEIRAGFKLHETLLRAAEVKVGKKV